MAIKFGKRFGTDSLLGTDGDDLLVAMGAKTTLDGGAGKDILLGGNNNDVLIGGKGADFLSGGFGTDTADYSGSSAGVTINLGTGKGTGGDAQGDRLISIDNLIGSAFDDTLIGDKGNNSFTGGDGNDIFGMTGGKDTITDFTVLNTPVVIDFNDLVPQYLGQSQVFIEPGYAGFDWGNGVYGASSASFPSAAPLGLGTMVAYLYGFEPEGTITTVGADFTLKSAYMGRIFDDYDGTSVQVMVQGWDDGALKATQTFQLAHGRTLINFVGFDSIDTLKIIVTGAGDPDVGFDDVTLAFEGAVDKIDVPVGTNIAALVASAVSDGNGGTLLTHSKGTLDLVGIDPGSVSADWFI